jgi:membrane protein DedA with SNARE-associated domain
MASVIISMSFLIGATLCARCNLFVLIPTIIAAMLGAALAGIGLGYQFWSLMLVIILTGTAIQLGYFIGAIAREALASHWVRRREVGTPHAEAAWWHRQIGAAWSMGSAIPATAETASAVLPARRPIPSTSGTSG